MNEINGQNGAYQRLLEAITAAENPLGLTDAVNDAAKKGTLTRAEKSRLVVEIDKGYRRFGDEFVSTVALKSEPMIERIANDGNGRERKGRQRRDRMNGQSPLHVAKRRKAREVKYVGLTFKDFPKLKFVPGSARITYEANVPFTGNLFGARVKMTNDNRRMRR